MNDRCIALLLMRSLNLYVLAPALGLLLIVGLNGCSRLTPIQYSPDKVLHGSLSGHPIEHVVIFAVDGLEHGTLVKYLMQNPPRKPGGLHDLLGVRVDAGGLQLTKAIAAQQSTTVFPSYTYPAWTSVFTGLFPGAHGIAGNSLFFREREVARYYTEHHIDAVKVQLGEDFLSDDINRQVNTIYEYIGQGGGQSTVVHHMLTRGSGRAINPDFDTLLSYRQNRSTAVDENSLWEAVKSLQDFNGGLKDGVELRLPSLMTIYFAGLDHAEHLSPENPEKARLEYLKHIDDLIAKFIAGDHAIVRKHHATLVSDVTPVDPIQWRGLRDEPVMQRTLFVFVSDHGHTPIDWDKVIGIDDLKVVFDELTDRSGKASYHLENPTLSDETVLSKVRALFGFFSDGSISRDSNVVATLNGGALGLYVKRAEGDWKDNPDYQEDIAPILKHLLLTLHKNEQGPEAVLYKQGNRYVFIPYRYDEVTVQLLPAVNLAQSPLNDAAYPMAMRRLDGLVSRLPIDPLSAPDIILLADRSKKFTFLNKQDGRVLEGLDVTTHRHFHSDHGHLNASDSLVPIIFVRGGQQGSEGLATICEASVVDVTPTILDVLGLLPSFNAALQNRPHEMKGHSLAHALDRILTKGYPLASENVCSSHITVPLP